MTPVAITALLEVHVSPPGHRPTLDRVDWLAKELYGLGRQDKLCALTAKGRAHVEQLMCLELPRQVWYTADERARITWEGQ